MKRYVAMLKLEKDGRRKYLLAAVAGLLAIALLSQFFPGLRVGETSDEIAVKQRKLAKYHEALREKKDLEARLTALNRTLDRLESRLLTGDTPALAAVDIQNLLNGIASRSAIDIRTMRVLKPNDEDQNKYIVIPVEFSITSTVRQLKEVLYRIESSPKYLTINNIRISAPKLQQPEQIQSTLTVAGFMKKPED
jgi:Tfp pilus assembly protein PilO